MGLCLRSAFALVEKGRGRNMRFFSFSFLRMGRICSVAPCLHLSPYRSWVAGDARRFGTNWTGMPLDFVTYILPLFISREKLVLN